MTTAAATVPLSQTFQLHSRPGSTLKIFLDFDGNNTTGTSWNSSNGMTNIFTPPYDTDGNPASFGDPELQNIQLIWQQVAEDYAQFDVDVTTADPGVEGLRKTSSSDQAYGVRACIGGSCYDWYAASAGGVSYLGDFNWNTDTPCFIFPAQLGGGYPKYVAEAVSHEVGHSLGLSHDGLTTGTVYYQGQGDWAPIMGVGYYRPITQFSKGEYANANNTQDDFAVMQSYGPAYRPDDHGNTAAAATVLPAGPSFSSAGTIERATDVDAFQFQSGPGAISITVAVSDPSPNLNVLARLYDSAGTLLASANPGTLGLTLTATVPSGTYTLLIEGVGDADPLTTGYSDYGSLGAYSVAGTVPATL